MSQTYPDTKPELPFRYRYNLRVRFGETDAQAVVFNANYWLYCDTAIVEYCRAVGYDYLTRMIKEHIDFTVAESQCRLSAGAVFDEWLAVDVRTVHLGRTSWAVEFRISSEADGRLIARIQNGYVFIAPGGEAKSAVPDGFRQAVLDFEGGSLTPAEALTPLLDSVHPKS